MARHSTLWDALQHWATLTPERVALSESGAELTYAALRRVAERRAAKLAQAGAGPGDRILIVAHNTLGWVLTYLAALRLGAIVVPMNNRLSPAQVRALVDLLQPVLVLCDDDHGGMFVQCDVQPGALEFELDAPPVGVPLPPLPAQDVPALISFTSGTTGIPKGALLTQGALSEASSVFHRYFETGPQDSTLVMAPMFHNTGFVDQFGHMLHAGGRTDLLKSFHRAEALQAFKETPATFVTAVPSVLRMLMLTDEADDVFGPAKVTLYGGSPMPAAWSREMFERWPHLRLVHGYGLTEFGSACSFLPSEYVVSDGESVGFAAPGVRLRIVGADGEDVTPGDLGEVWAAGPSRMTEYWCRPDVTVEKLSGEWLRTGDLGRTDERGLLFLAGRVDDVINRGGEKILPSYLESLLSERPDVAISAVVGVSDPVLLQVPVAAVEARPGHVFDPVGAREALAAKLPGYAVPAHFIVFDALPRIASGKVDRRAVQAEVAARLAKPFPLSEKP